MKFLWMVLLLIQPLFALEMDPSKMKVLQCMAIYNYDFVAEELGFSIAQVADDGKEEIPLSDVAAEKRRNDQTSQFLLLGKLTERPAAREKKLILKKDLAQRCQIVAETVIEVMAIKGHLEGINQVR